MRLKLEGKNLGKLKMEENYFNKASPNQTET